MFKIVDGDVFDANIDVLVQGCNCFTSMGSGVAKIVHKEYPEAYAADCKTIRGDRSKLGSYTQWTGNHSRIPNKIITIVNGYTQYDFGRDSNSLYANYDAIKRVMEMVSCEFNGKIIGMPFIGAGLASGNPETILKIFIEVFKPTSNDVTLYLIPTEFLEVVRGIY
jgi:O-acetyl-ADP-ribose deacetylase (regulator of RNase III)